MVVQGDKQMARTTKQTKTPATPGFAIKIKDDTELGLAILVAVYAAGGYRPIGWQSVSARRARSRRATGATTPAPPSRSTSCGRRVWKATTSGWRPRSAIEERDRGAPRQCHSFFRLRVGIAFRTSLFQFWARALRLGNLAPCPQIARGLERRRLRFGSLQQATR